MNAKVRVIVKLSIEGIHSWPECPYKEVAYLRNAHRHLFAIKAVKEVNHTNRDIEIILFKAAIISRISSCFGAPANFGKMSCEDIAMFLMKEFGLKKCEVLEDNENGAEVEV